jgi:DNA-binding MarR family transcriptional regulator
MTEPNRNEEVISRLVSSIRRLVRAVSADAFQMSRRYGLTSAQSGVLRMIREHGPLSSADLSRKLRVTPSNVTGIIDRLVKKALVERIPKAGDRRVMRIQLTKKGRDLAEILPNPIESKLINGLSDMESEHLELLCQMLRGLLEVIDTVPVTEKTWAVSAEKETLPEA